MASEGRRDGSSRWPCARDTFGDVGYRYDRDELLAAAVAAAYDDGIGQLTFGSLAKRLGINDRSIVYYFPTKADLLGEVMGAISMELLGVLDTAFGPDPLPADELIATSWPVLSSGDSDGVFALFFEVIGLSAARREPFATIVPTLMAAWVDWLEPRIASSAGATDGPSSAAGAGTSGGEPAASGARAEALRVIAVLDGALLLRGQLGADAADAAIRAALNS